MEQGNSITGYTASDGCTIEDWTEFALVTEQPVSGDLSTRDTDVMEERIIQALSDDRDLMVEAEELLREWDIPLRGKEFDDVVWLIRDGYVGGLIQFYMDSLRALDKITRK